MAKHVDLNADMGESFGPWTMGDDAALLQIVTSANVACGFHGGDWDVMARTMHLAAHHKVGVGAHPGFPDLQGFGRQRMQMGPDSLRNMITYQLGAAQAMAALAGTPLRHAKLHGALANMCAEDAALARVCLGAIQSFDPALPVLVQACTAQEAVAQEIGQPWAGEIFADRAYNDDGTLVDRRLPGAVIHDPAIAAQRMVQMLRGDAIICDSGQRLPAQIDTICLHGDTPEAVSIALAVRAGLEAAGIRLCRLGAC
ncbi:MAG: LamB/YcsF family protein [Rhodobacteraceae bacterium]|nr:LamB/YcsF family protein [Paracoccaceae bacterium]